MNSEANTDERDPLNNRHPHNNRDHLNKCVLPNNTDSSSDTAGEPVPEHGSDSKNESLTYKRINRNLNFNDIAMIPDIVKGIPQFYGNTAKLVQWISDVNSVVRIYTPFRGTYQY